MPYCGTEKPPIYPAGPVVPASWGSTWNKSPTGLDGMLKGALVLPSPFESVVNVLSTVVPDVYSLGELEFVAT